MSPARLDDQLDYLVEHHSTYRRNIVRFYGCAIGPYFAGFLIASVLERLTSTLVAAVVSLLVFLAGLVIRRYEFREEGGYREFARLVRRIKQQEVAFIRQIERETDMKWSPVIGGIASSYDDERGEPWQAGIPFSTTSDGNVVGIRRKDSGEHYQFKTIASFVQWAQAPN